MAPQLLQWQLPTSQLLCTSPASWRPAADLAPRPHRVAEGKAVWVLIRRRLAILLQHQDSIRKGFRRIGRAVSTCQRMLLSGPLSGLLPKRMQSKQARKQNAPPHCPPHLGPAGSCAAAGRCRRRRCPWPPWVLGRWGGCSAALCCARGGSSAEPPPPLAAPRRPHPHPPRPPLPAHLRCSAAPSSTQPAIQAGSQ
jgi:hypothetical protein